MTYSEDDNYPVRRFRFTVASLSILIILVVILGLLSHRTISIDRPVWKSAPYGNLHGTGSVHASH